MGNFLKILNLFVDQATTGDLKTSPYPKEWSNLGMRISFGMGAPARVPWIAFVAPEMHVSRGFYPVYLYIKTYEHSFYLMVLVRQRRSLNVGL